MAGNNNNNGSNGHGMNMNHDSAPTTNEGTWVEENRRVLGWVAELLNGSSRETALMELSKKREQVPELAMIIWHSFGMSAKEISLSGSILIVTKRCYDLLATRNHFSIPSTQSLSTYGGCVESCL